MLIPLPYLPHMEMPGTATVTVRTAALTAAAAAYMRAVEILTEGLGPTLLIAPGEDRPVFSLEI